ncbi:hypothetical protein [Maliponia aquimaris]|uniref:Periplasmic protein-like protein n=1 Tax=Maliponia aquimaris TaxID=1673631 RepID=A0A238L3A8_9RHOB|nr:hypothetical protein [Maliponia aquimaris]SMX49564.1 hypothetical protein MAA8898_04348 [Maliponia aquimaris]
MKPLARALFFLLFASPALAEPMTFRLAGNGGNCEECAWVVAEGEIVASTPDDFTRFMDGKFARLVVFDSPGGELGTALRLGRLLRERGHLTGVGQTVKDDYGTFSKVIEGSCESACAFAFMGGEARRIDEPDANVFVPLPGRIGMHRFYTREGNEIPSAATQQIMGQLLIYVQDMGVDPRVLSLASTASEDEMYFFSAQELSELRLVTTRSQGPAVPRIVADGLAVEWTHHDDARRVERYIQMHCRGTPDQWILTVTRLNALSDPGASAGLDFAPYEHDEIMYNDMHIRIAGEQVAMAKSDILAEQSNGRDLRLAVRLPVDIREHAGHEYRFVTTQLRMATGLYWAGGNFPDANTLNVLSRACITE